ncbi:MAG: bifunctional riboflavin kinase/FAD synthetase [Pirellulaceae bacterium]|nr:bifunctional riboflavin kinase/FAD synthetase [Pirellulaceae bacterium]
MKLVRNLDFDDPALRHGAITIGNFDGVHRGHVRIIEQLIALAREVGGPAVVFTFDPHPVRLLRPDTVPPPLTWTDRKAKLLADLGVDTIVVYPTDEALLALKPGEFFDQIVIERLQARAMTEGPNFFFGQKRAGNIAMLSELCRASKIRLKIVTPLKVDGQYVSSSRVRKLVSVGNVASANTLLTSPYRIRGMVTHGAARGAKIGFPTANVDAIDTLLPAKGVYACRAICEEGQWPAAVNIGPNPTFGDNALKVEVHLIGYSGSLYGNALEVDFLQRLRDIRSFDSIEQLKSQLARDVEAARAVEPTSE